MLRSLDDPADVAGAVGTAYLIVRPAGGLVDAFARWQGETLDRLGGIHAVVPAAHATLKAFGSSSAPLETDDEPRIVEAVAEWAAGTAPIELRAVSLDVFEGEERVQIVRLAPIPALADLWARATAAGLPRILRPDRRRRVIPHLSPTPTSPIPRDGPSSSRGLVVSIRRLARRGRGGADVFDGARATAGPVRARRLSMGPRLPVAEQPRHLA
jgi:hypothetical protein